MIARWCLSTFILSLTLFGVVSQHQVQAPNQEIVLQFTDVELTSQDVQNTIEGVKNQLLTVGGSHIKVKTQSHGKLKISYYSDADVSSIKAALSKSEYIALALADDDSSSEQFPVSDAPIKYDLDVYEIQSASHADWGFEGTLALQIDTKSDRFVSPSTSMSVGDLAHLKSNTSYKTTFKVCKNVMLTIGEALHAIPEVRAGPLALEA
ncbi:hypothetical protein F6U93_11770 [Tamlana haliotis]|uniref:HMA domain-containing protein n=1 Tax=Pseudotamlana haliotis TaxID=2614804 RepID=A0A6N6M9Z5_9FLAO|nr:hypothetical protein [Tamlana haliotis]KAB1067093.1 hypothetical protein F6U93_11770 [Tamlana haliotis]